MEPIYIIAITVGAVVLALLIICFYVLAKKRRDSIELRLELESVYSDPNLAKMEYDIAFYDDDMPVQPAHAEDTQVTIDEVMAGADKAPLTAEESAIFTKADDGMEEISGHYEPDEPEVK